MIHALVFIVGGIVGATVGVIALALFTATREENK